MLARTAPTKLCDYPVRSVEKRRYADTDPHGHITNTVFAVSCQNARMELLCDPSRVSIPHNTQFVIAKLVLEFRAEMHWPAIVEIVTRVERVGRSSATLARALFVDERCIAHRRVCRGADGHDDASVGPPEETVEALSSMAQAQLRLVPPAATSPVLLR